jgi:hypothetical protein
MYSVVTSVCMVSAVNIHRYGVSTPYSWISDEVCGANIVMDCEP